MPILRLGADIGVEIAVAGCRYEAWYIKCVQPNGLPFQETLRMLIAHKLGLNVRLRQP